MSDISVKVKAALYVKTNVSALVDVSDAAKLYGIYEGKAVSNIPVDRAYGVFNSQAPAPVVYTLGGFDGFLQVCDRALIVILQSRNDEGLDAANVLRPDVQLVSAIVEEVFDNLS